MEGKEDRTPVKVFCICLLCAAALSLSSPCYGSLPTTWWVGERCFLKGPSGSFDSVAVKDPSIVYYGGKYHLFYTGKDSSNWRMGYANATSIAGLKTATRTFMSTLNGGGYFCAPQVFWFEAKGKWYLIYQSGLGPTYSTNTDINNPSGWTAGANLGFSTGVVDYWCISDGNNVYCFYGPNDGSRVIKRRSITVANFPSSNWSAEANVCSDTFEAVHVYKNLADGKYYMMVEDITRHFELWTADNPGGTWTKLAEYWADKSKLVYTADHWTDQVSHGEIIRAGTNERMEINNIDRCEILIQGVVDGNYGDYGNIPYELGLIWSVGMGAPLNLTATGGESVVWLNWDDNHEPELAGYNVYRSTTSGSGYVKVNSSLVTDSNYTDSGLTDGIVYYYVVTAVDTNNNESRYSSEASASPRDLTPPAAPTGLAATAGDEIVWLDWNDSNEADFAGYNIYRSTTSGSGYVKLNTSLLTYSDYTDSNAPNGTTYYYVVTAVDVNSNESIDSNEVSVLPAAAVGGIGTILREWWMGISGGSVSDLNSNPNFPDNPTNTEQIKSLEEPTNWADSYGTRISGYLYPPETGSYTFWIASDANSELWLSTDSNPENASLIANVSGFTNRRQWDKYPQQQSLPISLNAGQKYYIEVLHKEDTGNDNVAVAWQGPGITLRQVIYGIYLSPYFTGFYGDFTDDSKVDMNDLADFTALWLDVNCQETSAIDLDGDCIVNFYEFASLAENWLKIIAPSAPANLLITAGATSVSLDWDDNTESYFAGYNVYRSTTSGSGYSKLNGSLLTSSNYTDSAATNGVTYYYVVTAVDIYSSESGYSNEVSRLVIQESTTGFCSVNDSIEHSNSGYTGTGYANTYNASGQGVNWKISIPSSGTYIFAWRYANHTLVDNPGKLLVNGSTVISSISFPDTGGWSSWSLVSVDCYLTAGENSIRLEATGNYGLANIDYLMAVGSVSLLPASCP